MQIMILAIQIIYHGHCKQSWVFELDTKGKTSSVSFSGWYFIYRSSLRLVHIQHQNTVRTSHFARYMLYIIIAEINKSNKISTTE